jgi:hypothetical protein
VLEVVEEFFSKITGDVATPGQQEISTPAQHDAGSNEEFEDDEDDAGKLPGIPDEGMDDKLRAVDVQMQRVLANAENELTNFGHHITGWDEFRRKHARMRRPPVAMAGQKHGVVATLLSKTVFFGYYASLASLNDAC